ncbi:MAG: hypothetical protein NDI90_15590 [Nitrospira sp. BO4]|jgi:hypothetical protein|nr:hypothetical protein [Nitrospira sp. BO4]
MWGLRTLQELKTRLSPDQLAPLYRAIDELRDFVGLLHMAATGVESATEAFKRITLSTVLPEGMLLWGRRVNHGPMKGEIPRAPLPGGRLLDSELLSGGGRPFPSDDSNPCGIRGPHPYTFIAAGLNAVGIFNFRGIGQLAGVPKDDGFGPGDIPSAQINGFEAAFTWIDRGYAGWAVRAIPIESALGSGRRLLSGEKATDFLKTLRGLGSPWDRRPLLGSLGECISEYQVCISEVIFTALPLLARMYTAPFPPIGRLSPEDQCLSGASSITVYPAMGQQFTAQADIQEGTFLTIDNSPAIVLSWSSTAIMLEIPAGITAGCHSVGWAHMLPSADVSQLRDIGEQCRPWFPSNSFSVMPYVIRSDQAYFSLIDAPKIDTFTGPNGSTAFNAEACTPITLTWGTSVDSCSMSAAKVEVTMLRDGHDYRTALPMNGQLQVSDDSPRTYTLHVQAWVGSRPCAVATKSVTIGRFNVLRAQVQGDTRCVDPEIGVLIDVTISCPAPSGGLPVTLTSSDATRIASATGMIEEGNRTATVEVLTGTECGTATLTVAVPNHPSKQLTVTVSSDPIIASLMPTAFQTCDPVQVTVTGSCLGERAADISAVIDVNGQPSNGIVTVLSPGTQIRIDFPALPAGMYGLAITHCNRVGYATSLLLIRTRPPSINSLTSPNSTVTICTTPAVKIDWSIIHSTSIVLTRNGTQIADRKYSDACSTVNDSVIDNLPLVTAGVTYVLTAFNAEGAMTTKTLPIPPGSPLPVASAMIATNSWGTPRNVFVFDPSGAGQFIGTINSGQRVSIPIPQCSARALVSIDPAAVAEHNKDFGDNLSPTSATTAALNGMWTRTTTGFFLGVNGASPVGVPV